MSAPWARSAEDVAAELETSLEDGLAESEAARRLARHGPNRLDPAPAVPAWRRALEQLADPLIYLLLAAVAVSLAAWWFEGHDTVPFEALVILTIIVLNAVLGYVQEARAEEAVAALQRMASATAGVRRGGVVTRVPATDLVPGDVLVLGEGDAVSADARLVETASLMVAEAALTGESEPVLKDPAPLGGVSALGDRRNMVFSGTAVSRGRGRAVVTGTGMATEIGTVARLLERTDDEMSPLQREVARIGRTLGLAVVAIAVVVVTAMFLTADVEEASDAVDVLLVGVSLAVAAVPEGLPAILSVVLALGVQRMAAHNAIVKRLSSVETLGSASVICTDKTGTLTRNEMTVVVVVTPSGEVEVSGTGYRPDGALLRSGRELDDPQLREEVEAVLTCGSLANDAWLSEEDGEWRIQGDPTEGALVVAETKIGLGAVVAERLDHRIAELPFSSERKLMSTVQDSSPVSAGTAIHTKGAPDVLLARCDRVRVGATVRPLTEEDRRRVTAEVDRLADQALRTLAVAYRPVEPGEPVPEGEAMEVDLVYLGMVGIIDPPRPEAKVAIAEARTAGVRVLMITGDHPRTARRIAGDLEIATAGSPVLTGGDLEDLSDGELVEAVRVTSVYARVAPEHKLRIVDALRADGHVVAMTGDGVNDAPALKSADIGVAMGITGTDVTKEAADMVLADDDFATIVRAVREGRGIFADIRRFLRFLLSSNIGEVATMFFGVVLAGLIGLDDTGEALAVPLLATQILWINLLTDSAPALALGLDPPPEDVMERPPRQLTDRVIDVAMWRSIVWVGSVMAVVTLVALDMKLEGGVLGGSGDIVEARTVAFTTLVLAQLFNCFNARSDRASAFDRPFTNPWLWGAVALSVALQVAVVSTPVLNEAFDTTPLGWGDWLLCIALASVVLWVAEAQKLVSRRASG